MKLGQWTTKKKIMMSGLVLISFTAAAMGSYYAWLLTPPPMPQSPQQALQVIGSPRYARMPEYRQRSYLERTQQLLESVSDDERRQLFQAARSDESTRRSLRQVRRQQFVQRAITFAKADPPQRTQMLDEMIDRMESRRGRQSTRRRPGQSASDGNSANRANLRGRFSQHIQERFEHGNPQINSLIGEYFRALHQRRQERGMSNR